MSGEVTGVTWTRKKKIDFNEDITLSMNVPLSDSYNNCSRISFSPWGIKCNMW